jgi:hydroxypyruvate reductase
MNPLAEQARAIFSAALEHVDVRRAVHRHVLCEGGVLRIAETALPLDAVDQLFIVAVGKAAVPMYQAVEEAVRGEGRLTHRAVVIAPQPPAHPFAHAEFFPGSHPTPDESSFRAADAVLSLLRTVTPRTAVLFLVSGGASAMMERPLDPAISLHDTALFHRALVASGLAIAEMNALRKHFSAVKGGRLAEAASAALAQCSLLISDVPSAAPDAIGSGPSLADTTTLATCSSTLAALRAASPLPESVEGFFRGPLCVETPKATDSAFARASFTVILSSEHLAQAAAQAARAAGFHAVVDNSCDEWEYRRAAEHLLDQSADTAKQHASSCLISVGEVSVALDARPGAGGRNQQFALWCAAELARRKSRAVVLSAGSDGIDGHSSAAGAVCDADTVRDAAALGLSVEDALAKFDSAPLLRRLGAEIVTGPTGNNLRDLRIILQTR